MEDIPRIMSLENLHDIFPIIPNSLVGRDNDDGYDSADGISISSDRISVENLVLNDVFKEYNVHLGGSSIGRNFRRAARYYLRNKAPKENGERFLNDNVIADNIESDMLCPDVAAQVEEPFYVCDLGVVVAQYYQWKKYFSRVDVFYAVKCNPDKAIIKTLCKLGASFDCASRTEINLVVDTSKELGMARPPEIIFANPCKPRAHIIAAVCKGVRMMTFDNVEEVAKCASISKKIQLILRIITDDSGSQCRLSSKFGAPKTRWRSLLGAARKYGLQVIGVSFHVGSGCRDSSRYDLALNDAKALFELAEREYGFKMTVLDIGGGFPGETHSLWNPVDHIDAVIPGGNIKDGNMKFEDVAVEEEVLDKEGRTLNELEGDEESTKPLNFFRDIADHVSPKIDEVFPRDGGFRVIAEPGRYLVAAACTLVCSVISVRNNATDQTQEPDAISDFLAARGLDSLTRDEEKEIVHGQGNPENAVIETIVEELQSYSKLYASQNLVQQEVDVWQDESDIGMLEAPNRVEILAAEKNHTAEGVTIGIVAEAMEDNERLAVVRTRSNSIARSRSNSLMNQNDITTLNTHNEEDFVNSILTIAAAGEAAVSGVVMQAVADSAPYQDDFAYYINDGVYGAFNNLMFDHASVRPRLLRNTPCKSHKVLKAEEKFLLESDDVEEDCRKDLFSCTIFGPTCDSIDVISRSVLLPKLEIGDWLYFQNMGAYTCAAASEFNGFEPSRKFYVCSLLPEELIHKMYETEEEKKDER